MDHGTFAVFAAIAFCSWLVITVFAVFKSIADACVPFVAVLPYPDPARAWPTAARERFDALLDAAADVIVLQAKVPDDRAGALGAIGRRDAWFARNASEALVVWDHDDADVGRLVRSFTDVLGELDVWVLDPAS